jgi:hypothetical protein
VKKYSDSYFPKHLEKFSIQLGKTPARLAAKRTGTVPDAEDEESSPIYSISTGKPCKTNYKEPPVPYYEKRVPGYRGGNGRTYFMMYLIKYLQELASIMGRTPSAHDISEECKISIATYKRYFGSVKKALKVAGLVPEETAKQHKQTDK